MPSFSDTPGKGVPPFSLRHRVEAPESYDTWHEYAFSVEPEAEDNPHPDNE